MTVSDIISALEKIAPPALQENYDNSGLITGNRSDELTGVLLCLDITDEIVDEAISSGSNMIVSHHPLIFKALKTLVQDDPQGRRIARIIKNNISVYSAHTSLDNAAAGLNHYIGKRLGLERMQPLLPAESGLCKLVVFCPGDHAEEVRQSLFSAGAGHIGNYDCCSYNTDGHGTFRALDGADPFVGSIGKLHKEPETRIETVFPSFMKNRIVRALIEAHPYEEVAYDIYRIENENTTAGAGISGYLPQNMALDDFLSLIRNFFGSEYLRHSRPGNRSIRKIAFCGGAGSFLIRSASLVHADVFVTADLKYHDFADCPEDMMLVDAGHFETEKMAVALMSEAITNIFPTFAPRIAEALRNPVHYH